MANDFTTKSKGIIRSGSQSIYPSVEALFGPWYNFEAFTTYLGEYIGGTVTDNVIPNGLIIGIRQNDGTVERYKWNNPLGGQASWVHIIESPAKSDVGLGNVDNTSDANKPVSTAMQAALDAKADASALTAHTGSTSNPHGVTASQLGLGNVENTADADKNVNSAVKDGSGNVITTTYETLTDAALKQAAIDALETTITNLTGLEGTNFGGFSIDAVEQDAIDAIATKYTADGHVAPELCWYLAGTGIDSLKAYRYDGSNTPVLVSSNVYDFTDFSGVSTQLQQTNARIDALGPKIDKAVTLNKDKGTDKVVPSDVIMVVNDDTYAKITIDNNNKIVEALKLDGTKEIYTKIKFLGQTEFSGNIEAGGLKTNGKLEANGEVAFSDVEQTIEKNAEWVKVIHDADNKIVFGIKADGTVVIPKFTSPEIEELQEAIENMSLSTSNLNGKKWVVIGDSFTAGSNSATFPDGKYVGKNKVYPYFIGNRTGIDVVNTFFASGRTLAFPEVPGTFTNSICNPSAACYYQNIPADADYITIYLGINDSHHRPSGTAGDGEDNTGEIPLGTISDATTATYYGAWNVVLTWLIENRPFAHIGIIVSNGCDTADYRTAQLAIARKYGIPFIDLNGDDRTPCMIRSTNADIAASIRSMRTRKQAVDYDGTITGSVNLHPNDDAHEYESYFIENFLLTL